MKTLNIPPPVHSADTDLPFLSGQFDDRDFEDFCADMFTQELGMQFVRYGRRGDSQHGIDLLSEPSSGAHRAVQCKRVRAFQPADVQAEITKVRDLPMRLSHLYFAVACDVSSTVHNTCADPHLGSSTAAGPIPTIAIWDRAFLTRKARHYPNLVGSYFGLGWRDHLFPDLPRADTRRQLDQIAAALDQVKKLLGLRGVEWPTSTPSTPSQDSVETTLERGLEGYFATDRDTVEFHGGMPSLREFSFRYAARLRDGSEAMLAMTLPPEDAVDLEAVLVMDQRAPASMSTYYSHDVLLTHISGPSPMVSLPRRSIVFSLARQSDYNSLLRLVGAYLDSIRDSALAARRERTLQRVAEGVPRSRALLTMFRYP